MAAALRCLQLGLAQEVETAYGSFTEILHGMG